MLTRENVKSIKIHVPIMRFTCYLNMGFNLKNLKYAQLYLHDITQKRVVALTDHFADDFGCKIVVHDYASVMML